MLSFKYAIKVWLTAVVIAPLLMLLRFLDDSILAEAGNYYLMLMVMGLVLSIPSWLCFWLAVHTMVYDLRWKVVPAKSILSLFAVVLTIGPFLIFDLLPDNLTEAIAYTFSIAAAIWLYKLPVVYHQIVVGENQ